MPRFGATGRTDQAIDVLAKVGIPKRRDAAVRGRELGLPAESDEPARYT